MSSHDYENDAQHLADSVGNKVSEFAGEAQQQFGNAVDSPKHQLKGAARKYAAKNPCVSRPTNTPALPLMLCECCTPVACK